MTAERSAARPKRSARRNPERSPTAKVLERLWQRWAQQYHQRLGRRPSKREVSADYFGDDPSLLAKWTTAAAKPRWRFPLSRLNELEVAFELSDDDVDDLMIARVDELQDDSEVLPALTWLAGFLERTSLDDDERDVLAAWRAERVSHQLGLYRDGRRHAELRGLLGGLLRAHEDRHLEEHEAGLAEGADGDATSAAALAARARAIGAAALSGVALRGHHNRARAETKALMRRLRQARREISATQSTNRKRGAMS